MRPSKILDFLFPVVIITLLVGFLRVCALPVDGAQEKVRKKTNYQHAQFIVELALTHCWMDYAQNRRTEPEIKKYIKCVHDYLTDVLDDPESPILTPKEEKS